MTGAFDLRRATSSIDGNDASDEFDPAFLDWLNTNRYENQKHSLKLYELLTTTELSGEDAKDAQTLVGVAFSLWRAVFLATGTREKMDVQKDATAFLATVLRDNAVLFGTDKKSSNWTFNYYAGSAEYRLKMLQQRRRWKFDFSHADDNAPPRKRWERLHDAFVQSVQMLRTELEGNRSP